jgi:hypothetical protein
VLALESAKRRVMHLAEGRTPVPIIDRQNDARHGGAETNETDLLTSRFREGSTIGGGAAISLSPSLALP